MAGKAREDSTSNAQVLSYSLALQWLVQEPSSPDPLEAGRDDARLALRCLLGSSPSTWKV